MNRTPELSAPARRRGRGYSLTLVLAALALTAACARDPGHDHDSAAAPAGGDDGGAAELPRQGEQELPPGVLEPVGTALDAYEQVRQALAADDLAGAAPAAGRVAEALEAASDRAGELSPQLQAVIAEAGQSAASLGAARSLESARGAFGELSRMLMLLLDRDPRLAEGWHAFSCPMTEGFDRWLQRPGEPANPYMGPAMLGCAEASDFAVPPPASLEEIAAHAEHAHGDPDEIAHYTCSMHPSVRSPDPGTCPICSMTLTPVTRGEAAAGVVVVDPERRQRIGVRVEPARRELLATTVRAVGRVAYDETRLADVSVKYQGWISELHVNQTGQRVSRGQTLFTLYSPELLAAQQELLAALASQRAAAGTSAPDRADYLVAAARRRLELWDLQPRQIDRLVETGQAVEHVPITSPASGFVVEKDVVAGGAVEPGMRLYRIAGLDRVWVEAEIYESEIPLVRVGDEARVTFPYLPGVALAGRVAFVHPYLDDATRTGRVRVELSNPGLELKPDMYADVTLVRELGERLTVPEDAVLYAGERRFVFLDLGEGRLRPQPVVVGQRSGERVELLEGVEEGELVVTSGNFLIAAESRLKLAMEHWGGEGDGPVPPPRPADPHAGH